MIPREDEHPYFFINEKIYPCFMRYAVKFAYDGSYFYGYARQPHLETVEEELIKTCIRNGIIQDISTAQIRSASRTDKGVSALCNVITFNTFLSKKHILKRLFSEHSSIIPYAVTIVDDDFNPRYAKLRQYRYYLLKKNRSIDAIIDTASVFTGEHNFSNFARLEPSKNPVRKIESITVTEEDDFLFIDFFAQTFLWHQIRRIISAVLKVEQGKLTKQDVLSALNNPLVKVDYGLAPAEPLLLMDITYDNIAFEYDPLLLDKRNRIEQRVKTRVKSLSF